MVGLKTSLEKEPLVTERPEGVVGGGDLPPRPPPPPDPPTVKTNNSVDMNYIDEQLTIISKRHKRSHCPEFLTALWMSFAAFTITFISFYIYVYLRLGYLGGSKESLFFGSPWNNESRVGSEVFFHHIVPRGGVLPFDIYSDFLSVTSREFPNLKFSVYFLLDDSLESYKRGSRMTTSMSFTKWVHHMDLPLKLRIKKFIKYHPNVNIIVMTLSNYMMRTPLKSKYNMMPRDFLEFYIRVLSVYLHGGAGLDLAAFNHLYATHQKINSQIAVILQTHNNGYTLEEYEMMIQSLQNNADDKTISSLFVLLSSMMDEAKSFLDSRFLPAFLFDGPTSNYAQLPKQRSRRAPLILRASPFSIVPIKPGNTFNDSKHNDTKDKSLDVAQNGTTSEIITTETNISIGIVNDSYIDNMDKENKQSKANDADKAKEINVVKITEINDEKNSKSIQAITTKPCTTTTCRLQAARLPEFPDLAIWSNQLAPYLLSPFGDMARQERLYSPPTADYRRYPQVVQATDDNIRYPQVVQATDDNRRYPQVVQNTADNRRYPQVVQAVDKNFISLDQYGEFMVATGRYHPLLEQVLLSGNYNLGPKFAIEVVIHEYCSGSMQYGDADDFCGTIHII